MLTTFEGRFIDPTFLGECVQKVLAAGKYVPSVLILSEDDFQGIIWAISMHGYNYHIINNYKKLGINRVVWAEDVEDGDFLLSSGAGLDPSVETIIFK